ncbi:MULTISPECIES: Brp/Blh family beta-carotene 15,15'-dioxygenase [Curtobacterium]|uniref:Brp/Blh family beta-carotene 15,15'-dioxygenase n=1 Tax=Curtobacterium flaccumfaciens TaxID=2035 RepID=UPI003EE58919
MTAVVRPAAVTATPQPSTAPLGTTPPALRSWIADRVLAPVTVLLGLVTLACATVRIAGAHVPMPVQLVPFAVSILVFGLPHGALDHLVPARLRPGTSTFRSVSVVVALYLVVGSATAFLWAVAPLAGFAAFIAITWFHWGQGDLFVDRLLGDGLPSRWGAVLTVAVRGALPMVVPFAAQPVEALRVVTGTAASLRGGTPDDGTVPTPVRAVAAALVVVLVVVHLVALRRSGTPLARQAAEDVVLLAVFAVVPPVLAVGLYFTLWHAVRHIVRLELTDPRVTGELHRGRLLAPFLRFTRQAWPVTAIAVAVLVALAVVLRRADLGVYLALIAALTTPHTVVVTWMDHRQRTWRQTTPTSTETSPP